MMKLRLNNEKHMKKMKEVFGKEVVLFGLWWA